MEVANQKTALHYAFKHQHKHIVDFLLEHRNPEQVQAIRQMVYDNGDPSMALDETENHDELTSFSMRGGQ